MIVPVRVLTKCFPLVPVAALLSSCADFNKPLDSGFNPLDPPGLRTEQDVVDVTGPAYTPGQWLETTIPSTAFYDDLPSANDQPKRQLEAGTVLKVISTEGTYVRVELESGDVGYVPSIMVAERPAAGEVPVVPLTPDGVSAEPGGLAPEPEVAPLEVAPADGLPGRIDPGEEIE